ncbi:MAG: hypothetical protein ABI688_00185 [Bacteroidota bacterium]
MEVHHHAHPSTAPGHRKKWTHYLWEFLMLFLAVFCGFMAENLREHIVEKKKEKHTVETLVDDIIRDSVSLHSIINVYMPEHSAWVDSSEYYISTLPLEGNERKITKVLINATNWNLYSPPEVALDMLKNSGSLNLIKNKKVKEEIIKYNGIINKYITYSEYMLALEHSIDTATTNVFTRPACRVLIERAYFRTNADIGALTDSDIPEIKLFKTYNKAAFIDYIKKFDAMDYLLRDLLGLYNMILKEEITLINVLKEEYHLE